MTILRRVENPAVGSYSSRPPARRGASHRTEQPMRDPLSALSGNGSVGAAMGGFDPARTPLMNRGPAAATADDDRRSPVGEPDHLPRRSDHGRVGEPHRDEAAVSPEREPQAGRAPVRQQPRRERDRHHGDLRHDAVRRLRRVHLLRGHGGQRRGDRAGRRHQGQTLRPAARQDDDPPAPRRSRRAGERHRNPGRGHPRHPANAERDPRRPHRSGHRHDRQGHRTRSLPHRQAGGRIRPDRRGPGEAGRGGNLARADARDVGRGMSDVGCDAQACDGRPAGTAPPFACASHPTSPIRHPP